MRVFCREIFYWRFCHFKGIISNIIKIKNMSQWQKMQKFAAKLALEAGEKLLKDYQNFDRSRVNLKSDFEIVTESDLSSEKLILHGIIKEFPEHGILSEETGEQHADNDYLWIIDPIDGTTNFSIHDPMWSISIALAYQGEIKMGLIYAPVLGEMFTAILDESAELNGRKIQVSDFNREPLVHTFCHGSQIKDIKRAVKYYTQQKNSSFECRQLGSAALELAYVACGRVESLVIPGTKPWDVAAGVLITRMAGGKVTDFKGKNWTLDENDILASNGKTHLDLLKITPEL